MRSHIWTTRGPGNFPKLVQSRAQTTARARDAEKAAPPPPPPPPPAAGRRRRALESSGRLQAPFGPGPRLGRGVLRGAGGGRAPSRHGGPARCRRRPAHFPSFVTERSKAGGPLGVCWRGGGAARGGGGSGPGTRCGSRGWPSARGAGGEKLSAPSCRRSLKEPRRETATPTAPSPPQPPPRRPAFLSAQARGAGPQCDPGTVLRVRVLRGPAGPARAPAAPPPGRPRAPPGVPAPPGRLRTVARGGPRRGGLGEGRESGPWRYRKETG